MPAIDCEYYYYSFDMNNELGVPLHAPYVHHYSKKVLKAWYQQRFNILWFIVSVVFPR